MYASRLAVAIPLGALAATVLALIALALSGAATPDITQPNGQAVAAVWAVGSVVLSGYLALRSPSARETFRRSLPVIGLASLCLDVILIAQLASGAAANYDIETHTDPFGVALDAFASAVALVIVSAPILCPVLYYWVVPSEDRPAVYRSYSESRRWTLTWLVTAGAVAACGLAFRQPFLALLGIVGVVVLAVRLIWME